MADPKGKIKVKHERTLKMKFTVSVAPRVSFQMWKSESLKQWEKAHLRQAAGFLTHHHFLPRFTKIKPSVLRPMVTSVPNFPSRLFC